MKHSFSLSMFVTGTEKPLIFFLTFTLYIVALMKVFFSSKNFLVKCRIAEVFDRYCMQIKNVTYFFLWWFE